MEPQNIQEDINDLRMRFNDHTHNAVDSQELDIDTTFKTLKLPKGLQDAPQATIANPTGGSTVDAEARTAITALITELRVLGLIE